MGRIAGYIVTAIIAVAIIVAAFIFTPRLFKAVTSRAPQATATAAPAAQTGATPVTPFDPSKSCDKLDKDGNELDSPKSADAHSCVYKAKQSTPPNATPTTFNPTTDCDQVKNGQPILAKTSKDQGKCVYATATVPATDAPTPTQGAGNSTTGVLASPPPSSSPAAQALPCRLHQTGPWNELPDPGAAKQRIEVGGGDVAAYDLYQVPPSVTLIVPVQEPKIYYGFGTAFWGNQGECKDFDWIAAFTQYAKDRSNNGHSGVVIDLRSGTPKVVANINNLNDAQLAGLLAQFKDLFDTNAVTHGAAPAPLPTNTGGSGSGASCKSVGNDHPAGGANDIWSIPADNTWRVVLWWSKNTDPNVKNMKTLLQPGQSLNIIGGGGTLVTFNGTNCGDSAQARMQAEKDFNEPTPAQQTTYFR